MESQNRVISSVRGKTWNNLGKTWAGGVPSIVLTESKISTKLGTVGHPYRVYLIKKEKTLEERAETKKSNHFNNSNNNSKIRYKIK